MNHRLPLLPGGMDSSLAIRRAARPDAAAAENSRLCAQILDAVLRPQSHGEAGPLRLALQEGRATNMAQALATLNPNELRLLNERLGRGFEELSSLSHERDARIFHHALLEVGHRFEGEGNLEMAGLIYSALSANSGHAIAAEVSSRAQARFNAMNGMGDWRARLAFNLERLPENATRWDMLVAMGGAGLIARGVRLAATARWAGSFESAFALSASTHATAFLAESLAFTGLGRLAGSVAGQHYDWSPEGIFNEWAGGAAMLLGLKAMGGVFGRASERMAAGETAFARVTRAVAPQAGMFAGIVFGNRLAELGGFHPERHGDTWWLDGLTTLLEFNVAGRLQQAVGGPGLRSLEGRMEAYTQSFERSGARHPSFGRGLTDFFATELISPEGIHVSSSDLNEGPRAHNVYTVRHEGHESPLAPPVGSVESTPPPPVAGSIESPLPPPVGGRPPRSSKGVWVDRLVRWTERISSLDLLRFRDPDGPLADLHRSPLPSPVESIEQGMLLAIARGNPGERQLKHTRRVLDQTRDLPRTREAYLAVERSRLELQRGMRERLDPILKELRMPDYRDLSSEVAEYEHATQEALGRRTPFEADALINLRQAQQILANPELRRSLSAEDLSRMGYEPRALEWLQSHFDAFPPGALELVLRRNPELANTPEAAEVLKALAQANPEHPRSLVRVRGPLRELVATPERAALWLSELSLQASAREMLRRNPGNFLNRVLERMDSSTMKVEDISEFAGRLETYKAAATRLRDENLVPRPRGLLGRAARLLGIGDYQNRREARGEYMRATLDLLIHHENLLIPQAIEVLNADLAALPSARLDALTSARSALTSARREVAAHQLEIFQGLEAQIRELWNYHDTQVAPLRETGSRVGLTHVQELLEGLRGRLGEARFQSEVAPRFEAIVADYEAARATYRKAAADVREGKMNPRDFNRSSEKMVELVYRNAYDLYFELAKAHGIETTEVRRILPMFETFTAKADLPREMTGRERWGRILRYALPALQHMAVFKSARRRGYDYETISREFQNFGADIGSQANPQTFYYDPALQNVLQHLHFAVSADHNTHLDFIGHAGNLIQGMLGDRATSQSIPDILAKVDLSIPLIEDVFPYITNKIPNDPTGVRRAELRGAHMQAFGSLAHDRMQPTMPLAYDNITMDVTNGEGPYTRDPHAPISGSLPVMGRLFGISEATAVITGQPQGIVFAQDPGAIRNYPSQRGSPVLLNNPSSMVSAFFPLEALPAPARNEKITARNGIERLMWYLQGFHPATDPAAPHTDAIYRDYTRPTDPDSEARIAALFNGAWELYPTAEGIRDLEAHSREALGRMESTREAKDAEGTTRALQDYELVQQVLDVQTRQLLRNELTVFDQRLATELAERPDSADAKGLRRMQRILRARLKTMESVERKTARREELSLTERRFVERAGTAIAGRDNVSGTDHILEQLNYYFAMRDVGVSLETRLLQSQENYYGFVRQWNEARKDPARPEYSQVHVSEAPGYDAAWSDYRMAIETLYNVRAITPERWSGEIFKDIVFRREGSDLIMEPRNWEASTGFSRPRLWRFLFDDTIGIVSLARKAKDFDSTPNLYSTLHRGWGHQALATTSTRVRIKNADRLRDVANTPVIFAPTHDSMTEFPILPSLMHDYGFRAFFLADKKFFDTGFHPPAFGLIAWLLGPMKQYGHFEIDRENRELALESMKNVGRSVAETGKSAIVFPGGTRNSVRYRRPEGFIQWLQYVFGFRNELRYEGPTYAAKSGLALSMEAGQSNVVPLGLVNGGVIAPKQFLDAFVLGGTAVGREYAVNVGEPIFYDQLIPDNPTPRGPTLRRAVMENLDRQHHELTGREIAAPAESKAKTNRKERPK